MIKCNSQELHFFVFIKFHQRNAMLSISVFASTYGRKPVYARENTKASGILTRFSNALERKYFQLIFNLYNGTSEEVPFCI